MTALRGRRIGSLFTVWAAVVFLAAVMYWFQGVMPAFIDMLRPLYVALGILLLVATGKWLRQRTKNHDRRLDDRRHPDLGHYEQTHPDRPRPDQDHNPLDSSER